MLRILMVLEDYGELVFLQTVFKKVGFDVDAIQSPRQFEESFLRMNPDVVLMTAFGKRVRGVEMARQINKKGRGNTHVILLFGANQTREVEPAVHRWVTAPASAPDLLDVIAEDCNLNKQLLREKWQRLNLQETVTEPRAWKEAPSLAFEPVYGEEAEATEASAPPESTENSGTLKPSAVKAEERALRYDQFLQKRAAGPKGFPSDQVKAEVKALREAENTRQTSNLEDERQAFVKFLFAKKKTG